LGTHDFELRLQLIVYKVVIFCYVIDIVDINFFLNELEHPLDSVLGADWQMHGAQRLTDLDLAVVASSSAARYNIDHKLHLRLQSLVYQALIRSGIVHQVHTFITGQAGVELFRKIRHNGCDQLADFHQDKLQSAISIYLVLGELHSPESPAADTAYIPV
jgi:hypothetical protein